MAMPTTLIEIFRDSEMHHRPSLFDLPDRKAIEALLFEKSGKPWGWRYCEVDQPIL